MTTNGINHETGEAIGTGRSPRFTMWVAFLVFSTITMGSAVEVKNHLTEPNKASGWAVACAAVTFTFTILVVVGHVVPIASTLIVGTRLEGFLIFVLTCFWAATVAIVSNPTNGLSVSTDRTAVNQVVNGNLYYFSWAGFVTAVVLLINYLKHAFGVDMVGTFHNRSQRLSLWAGLLASSLVVMGSSVRILTSDCTGDDPLGPLNYCRRTKFAISIGTIGVVFAIVVVLMKFLTTSAPFVVEFALSIVLAILDAFGVAYVTSPTGPGSPIGNLYYFSWISFLQAALLMADCFNQRSGGGAAAATGGSEIEATGNGDLNLKEQQDKTEFDTENFDDQI